jgi:hypothetical protein
MPYESPAGYKVTRSTTTSPFSFDHAQPLLRLGTGRDRAPSSTPNLTKTGTLLSLCYDRRDNHLGEDAIPAHPYVDKTASESDDDRYGTAPSKPS